MKELGNHLEFVKVLGGFSLGAIAVTFIAYLIFKKNRVVKYIPGFFLILIGVYNLFYVGTNSSTLEEVNRLFMVITTMISGFIGLSTGLIIGIFNKGRK